MSRRLVACDLDGTLTFTHRRPDEVVIAALRRLIATDGVRLVIATARSSRSVREWFPDLLDRIEVICCNGAWIHGRDVVEQRHLPARRLAIVLRRLDRAGVDYCLERGTHFVATAPDALPWMGQAHRVVRSATEMTQVAGVLKCSVESAAAAQRAVAGIPGLAVVPHASGDADLVVRGVSKATALDRLRQPGESVVALGNDHNDAALLRRADVSYVVGQGLRELDRYRHVGRIASESGVVAAVLMQVADETGALPAFNVAR